jgi:hypothetical protein
MYEMLCPPRPSKVDSTALRVIRQARRLRLSPDKPYEVEMARSGPILLRAWSLMYRVYLEKGYAQPDPRELWYGLHDAVPGTGTIVAFDGDDMVGTVSVIPDSPLGYPAEKLYEDEVEELKEVGRRPVEVGSLAVCPTRERDLSIVTNLFDLLSLYARDVRGATDLIITVNPRHEKFYKRMLLFERMGDEKSYDRVGKAPSVFMRLDLDKQRQVIRWEHGEGPLPLWHNGKHTMYRGFSSMKEETRRIDWLERENGPLDEDTVLRYFVEERPLVQEASLAAQLYLERCYPEIAWYAPVEAV